MPFHPEQGEPLQVELMLNAGIFNYTDVPEHGAHMLALPYQGGGSVLYVLKPRRRSASLASLLQSLEAEQIERFIDRMHEANCVVRFPKMKISQRSDIRNTLEKLGVHQMFSTKAHFGLMVESELEPERRGKTWAETAGVDEELRSTLEALPNPGLHVDVVVHQVDISIDEYGTEASAGSAAILKRTAQLFIVDSPFYFFIRDERTRLVTFSAAIRHLDPVPGESTTLQTEIIQ